MIEAQKWSALAGDVVGLDNDGNPQQIAVSSDSSPDPYLVRRAIITIVDEATSEESYILKWACTCKAYEYGGGKPCKHIKRAVPESQLPDLKELTGHD